MFPQSLYPGLLGSRLDSSSLHQAELHAARALLWQTVLRDPLGSLENSVEMYGDSSVPLSPAASYGRAMTGVPVLITLTTC